MNKKLILYLTLYNKCTWTRLDTGGVNMMNMSRRSVDWLGRLVLCGTEVQMTRGSHRQIQGLSALYIGGEEIYGVNNGSDNVLRSITSSTMEVRKVLGSTMDVRKVRGSIMEVLQGGQQLR